MSKKVHKLIQSLSKSEKRVVKIRLRASKTESTLLLYFDILCKQPFYNIEELIEKGKKSSKLTQSSLGLLFDVILKFLRQNESNIDLNAQLEVQLQEVQVLNSKGLFLEATKKCNYVIKRAEALESFEILIKSYKALWNIHLLQAELNSELATKLTQKIKSYQSLQQELDTVECIYRELSGYYYEYYFSKTKGNILKDITALSNKVKKDKLRSSRAKHVYFEIKSIEALCKSDVIANHTIRKEHLLHLLSSECFREEYLIQLKVMSHLFVKTKSCGSIYEHNALLGIFYDYFYPIVLKLNDRILQEKYYEVYYSNKAVLISWTNKEEEILKYYDECLNLIDSGKLAHPFIVGRIFVILVEVLVFHEYYNRASLLINRFFEIAKKSKYSVHYIEVELLYAIVHYCLKNLDLFESILKSITKKIQKHGIALSTDFKTMLLFLTDISKDRTKRFEEYADLIKNRHLYKLFIFRVLHPHKDLEDLRQELFVLNDQYYSSETDEFLLRLKALIHN